MQFVVFTKTVIHSSVLVWIFIYSLSIYQIVSGSMFETLFISESVGSKSLFGRDLPSFSVCGGSLDPRSNYKHHSLEVGDIGHEAQNQYMSSNHDHVFFLCFIIRFTSSCLSYNWLVGWGKEGRLPIYLSSK